MFGVELNKLSLNFLDVTTEDAAICFRSVHTLCALGCVHSTTATRFRSTDDAIVMFLKSNPPLAALRFRPDDSGTLPLWRSMAGAKRQAGLIGTPTAAVK